ncbi:somatostatin receptor type 4-like [Montipora capricornis]|uniref:somatostatin receptor type 4-like n=1 Tax=Montipora capricornis TaxID=246305 RepID=UPI0035F216E2
MQQNSNISLGLNSSSTLNKNEAVPNIISLTSFTGIFFFCFYIFVFFASNVGNIVVLYICNRRGRNAAFRPTRTGFFNCYIANLAIADLLFTQLTVFDVLYAVLNEWVLGAAMCKIQGFFIEMCYSASILTLIAISRERLKSFSELEIKSRIQRIKTRKLWSVLVWIMAFLLCSPLLYAYRLDTSPEGSRITVCNNLAWSYFARQIYYSLATVVLFIFPLAIMLWTQFKIKRVFRSQVSPNHCQIAVLRRARQKKASRMLRAVCLCFVAFWAPFIITRTLRYFKWYEGEIVWKLSQLLTMASAAANPFIYSFYILHFRVFIKRFITCRCGLMSSSTENVESSIDNTVY